MCRRAKPLGWLLHGTGGWWFARWRWKGRGGVAVRMWGEAWYARAVLECARGCVQVGAGGQAAGVVVLLEPALGQGRAKVAAHDYPLAHCERRGEGGPVSGWACVGLRTWVPPCKADQWLW